MSENINRDSVASQCSSARIVEILDPRGEVSYRRPVDDLAVWQALRTRGYAVRAPLTFRVKSLDEFPCVAGRSHKVVIDENGVTVYADEHSDDHIPDVGK